MVTDEVYAALEDLYAALDKVVNLVGLEYDLDDGYICRNTDQVNEGWCDDEMLARFSSIEW